MTIYISKREKIQADVEKFLKYVNEIDLDYRQVLDYIAFNNHYSKAKVKEILDFVIDFKGYTVTDDWAITLKDKDLPDWFKRTIEKEKKLKELDEEMAKIEALIKKEEEKPKG